MLRLSAPRPSGWQPSPRVTAFNVLSNECSEWWEPAELWKSPVPDVPSAAELRDPPGGTPPCLAPRGLRLLTRMTV